MFEFNLLSHKRRAEKHKIFIPPHCIATNVLKYMDLLHAVNSRGMHLPLCK
jgi:hypothetical protein